METALEEEERAARLEAYILRKRAEAAENYLRNQQGQDAVVTKPPAQTPTMNPSAPAAVQLPPLAVIINGQNRQTPPQCPNTGIPVYSYYP